MTDSARPDQPVRLVIDATGGQYAPEALVEGALLACDERPLQLALVGDSIAVTRELARFSRKHEKSLILHHAAPKVGLDELRSADAVLTHCCALLREDQADALVSAGRTQAIRTVAARELGLLPNVRQPAKLSILPAQNADRVVLDVGAGVEAWQPEDLVSHAFLGASFVHCVYGIDRPSVALITDNPNHVSSPRHRDADALLRNSPLNYKGCVRGREIFDTDADVFVTDGFTGNVMLSAVEGVVGFLQGLNSSARTTRRGFVASLRSAIAEGPAKEYARRLDSAQLGGAPFLGVKGVVVVAQSTSDARAIKGAILAAASYVEARLLTALAVGAATSRPDPDTKRVAR